LAKETLQKRQEEVNAICDEAGLAEKDYPKVTAFEDNVSILYIKISNNTTTDHEVTTKHHNDDADAEGSETEPTIVTKKDDLQTKMVEAQELLSRFSSFVADMKAVSITDSPATATTTTTKKAIPRKKSIDRHTAKTTTNQRKKSLGRSFNKVQDTTNGVTVNFVRKASRDRAATVKK